MNRSNKDQEGGFLCMVSCSVAILPGLFVEDYYRYAARKRKMKATRGEGASAGRFEKICVLDLGSAGILN
jgi:hypothetical protein